MKCLEKINVSWQVYHHNELPLTTVDIEIIYWMVLKNVAVKLIVEYTNVYSPPLLTIVT